jgi:hypothetical protein
MRRLQVWVKSIATLAGRHPRESRENLAGKCIFKFLRRVESQDESFEFAHFWIDGTEVFGISGKNLAPMWAVVEGAQCIFNFFNH